MERGLDKGSRYGAVADRAQVAIGMVAIAVSAWLAIRYSGQPILDFHAFRETQTALTAFWMTQDGFRLAYETPVLGKPWSIPFEFPLYQYLVAETSFLTGVGLERTGRLVSYLFLLACVVPVAFIGKRLFPASWRRFFWVFAALFLSSPLYLYWGRSFMIETAALFFTLCFLHYALALVQNDYRLRSFVLAGAFLTLALLQKLTTVLPDLLIIGPILLLALRDRIGLRSSVLWKAVAAFGFALAAGYAWEKYSDALRAANMIAATHLTTSGLAAWNFGTLAARVGRALWVDVVWQRTIELNSAGVLGVSLIVAALVLADRQVRILIALCLALFLSHFLVFENLHFVHAYYQVSTAIFLIVALALAVHGLAARFPNLRYAFPVITAVLVIVNFFFFANSYLPMEQERFGDNNATLAVAKLLRERTDPARPIVVYGYDWSSEVPFFSRRRAMVVPSWLPDRYDVIDDPARFVGTTPSAIAVCGDERVPVLKERILREFKPGSMESTGACDVYFS